MAQAVNHAIGNRSRLRGVSSLGLLIGLILISFPAAANETCIAVKTFGVEAVSKKSISELIIFAKDKRYDVKGDVQTEATIKSIKLTDGGFRITETFTKGAGWLGFKRKATYLLNVIGPQTIEIWDGMVRHRYAKCGRERPPI